MRHLLKDVRYALRMLSKSRGFAAAAIISLALSIGATTTVFSFVNAILLRAIPYENPDCLVQLFETNRKEGNARRGLSYPDYTDWRDQSQSFERVAAYAPASFTLGGETPVRVAGELVSAGYFDTLGASAAQGRTFTPEEDVTPDTHPVAVISPEDALGKRIKLGRLEENVPWITVVGVTRDVKFRALTETAGADPDVYFPLAQLPTRSLELLVRTDGDPADLFNAFRREVLKVDSQLPPYDLMTMGQRLARQTAQSRFNVLMLGVFAFIALLLATVGIYGVTSYTVSQRTHEIGIRMGLGARGGDILRLILYQGLVMTAAGLAIGLTAALLLGRVMDSLLYGIAATDLTTFAFATLVLAATALLASFIPARRALRVEPLVALRNE